MKKKPEYAAFIGGVFLIVAIFEDYFLFTRHAFSFSMAVFLLALFVVWLVVILYEYIRDKNTTMLCVEMILVMILGKWVLSPLIKIFMQ